MVEARRGPTREQRLWIAELGALTGVNLDDAVSADDSGAPSNGTKGRAGVSSAVKAGNKSDLVGGILPIPIPEAVTSRITIQNRSQLALQIVPGSAKPETKPADFVTAPPLTIAAGVDGTFAISNALLGSVPAPVGTGGEVKYAVVDDLDDTTLFMKWERGFLLPSHKTTQDVTPKNDAKFKLDGFHIAGDDFAFVFTSKVKPPNPGPGPGPAPDVNASCQITVANNTLSVLKLAHQQNELGDFMTNPAMSLQPGGSTAFVYVQTPHDTDPKQQGCKGSLTWEVGSPAVATWRVEWANPVGQKNSATANLDPQSGGFESLEQVGQGDENVPVAFTLSGGGVSPGPDPGPGPGPTPGPSFQPPAGEQDPTLRRGDKSADGWVEYLQQMLNAVVTPSPDLKIDGNFGPSTYQAVVVFQKSHGIQVDGIVGNQTWAALRDGTSQPPSTDGRTPHTFVDHGVKARWLLEDEVAIYLADSDSILLSAVSVGDTDLKGSKVTVRITPPGADPKVVEVAVGGAVRPTPDGQGQIHDVILPRFKASFPSRPPGAKVADYFLEAYFNKELGGDFWKGKPFE